MNIIQPLDLETSFRTFSFQTENYLVVTTKLYFPLHDGDPLLFSDAYQLMSALPLPFIDEGLPKVTPEYFITGNAIPPNGKPVTAMSVSCKLADTSKRLHVTGDRYWMGGVTGTTKPLPFTEMPLTWDKSFGGKSYDANPYGQGIDKVSTDFGEKLVKMPNIEYSKQLLTSLSQRPTPAGFSVLSADHPKRLSNMGTYDETWLKEDFPGYPKDFNFSAFNCAMSDQALPSPIIGGEEFELEGFHEDFPVLKGSLPNFKVKVFAVKKGHEISDINEDHLETLTPKIDTVVFFPNQLMGMLIYRATIKIESVDGSEYQHLISAYEDNQTLRNKTDYLHSLIGRVHPDLNMQYALTTKDLIPTSIPCGMARLMNQEADPKSLLAEHIESQLNETLDKSISETKQQLQDLIAMQKSQGIDTTLLEKQLADFGEIKKDEWQLKFEAITDRLAPMDKSTGKIDLQKVDFKAFDDLSKLSEEYALFQKKKAEMQLENQINEAFAQGNTEVANALERSLEQFTLPPILPRPADPKSTLERVKSSLNPNDTQLDIADLESKLEAGYKAQVEGYKMGAHMMDIGRIPLAEKLTTLQSEVDALIEKKASLKYMDLAGLDFSNRDLSGIDFSYCYLEQCNFSHANLTDTNFEHAIAARSNFQYATLINTCLNQSNIGACDFTHSTIDTSKTDSIECAKSNFSFSKIKHLSFVSCLNLLEIKFKQTQFDLIDFTDNTFLEVDFSQCIFNECTLSSTTLQQCSLSSSIFNQSTIIGCNFIECELSNINVKHSDLTNSRFLNKTKMSDSIFYHSILADCTIKDINIENCQFISCTLNCSDFSDALAKNTVFDGSTCKDALFIKSNLSNANLSNANFMYSNFMQAKLVKTNLSHSNLFGCEFLGAYTNNTDFSKSNLNSTKLENWRPNKWQ